MGVKLAFCSGGDRTVTHENTAEDFDPTDETDSPAKASQPLASA